jgi:hypothetical protein
MTERRRELLRVQMDARPQDTVLGVCNARILRLRMESLTS